MARFALLPTPLSGHVNPTLAMAQELVRRGEQVTYWLPESFRPDVEATGAALRPIRMPPPQFVPAAVDPLTKLTLTPVVMTRASLSVLPQVLDQLCADAPDVIAYDALSVWGRIAAELVARPAAMLWASYAMNERFSYLVQEIPQAGAGGGLREPMDAFATDMHVLSASYGTQRLNLPDLFLHAEPLTIVFVPRALQPAAGTFDDRYRFVGPSVRDWEESLDPEVAAFASGPVVYVSLGTVFNDWPEFYPLCHEAFAPSSARVLVAGKAAGTGPAPPNVLTRARVPQLAVLGRADVFVTHGGMSSVMEGLRAGVPMVLVPQVPEQALTAERVVAAGAGLLLHREEVTALSLRRSVERLAAEPAHRHRARQLWASFGGGGGAAAAAAALDDYARLTAGARFPACS